MRLLKFLLRVLLVLVFLVPLLLLGFLETVPLVPPVSEPDPEDVRRARALLLEHDPRKLRKGEIRSVSLSERDVNLVINHALWVRKRVHAYVDLHSGLLTTRLALRVPENPIGVYLNVSASLSQVADRLQLDSFHLGSLAFPVWMIEPLMEYGYRALLRKEEVRVLLEALNGFRLLEREVLLMYQWQPDLVATLEQTGRNVLLLEEDQARLLAYTDRLGQITGTAKRDTLPLTKILQPMFMLARERAASGEDPRVENRALILALAFYVTGTDVVRMLGVSADNALQRPRALQLTLIKRTDLMRHFVISAAITVAAGAPLADAVGLFKELEDSRGGTGFSFADLAADRAGVRFGGMATSSRERAAVLQDRMSQVLWEQDFMPKIDDLPEAISEMELERGYQGADGAVYRRVDAEIESRLSVCKVYY